MRFRSLIGICALSVGVPVIASAQGGQKLAYVNSAVLMQSAPGRAEAEAAFEEGDDDGSDPTAEAAGLGQRHE